MDADLLTQVGLVIGLIFSLVVGVIGGIIFGVITATHTTGPLWLKRMILFVGILALGSCCCSFSSFQEVSGYDFSIIGYIKNLLLNFIQAIVVTFIVSLLITWGVREWLEKRKTKV